MANNHVPHLPEGFIFKQATNHQPPQPVVYRHPVQPAERPRPHTYQPDPAPAVSYRTAGQAKPEQVLNECLLNLAGMGVAGLALMGLVSAFSHPAQSPYHRPAVSYGVSRASAAPAPTAEQREQKAQRKAEQKARELAEQIKQHQARDAQRQQREQAEAERSELLQQVAEANRKAEQARSLADAQRKQFARDNAINACMNRPGISAALSASEIRRVCTEQVFTAGLLQP
jgi:flagellar biosynthesis GTPase FlhF